MNAPNVTVTASHSIQGSDICGGCGERDYFVVKKPCECMLIEEDLCSTCRNLHECPVYMGVSERPPAKALENDGGES